MRTLIVTHYFPPEIGAPQARLSELARYWADAGDDVTVLTAMPNHPTGIIHEPYRRAVRREEQADGYRIVRTWVYATPNEGIVKKTLGHVSFMATSVLLGLKRVGKPDVVVVSSPTFFSIFSAWLIARVRRARFVVEVRDLWPAIFVELGVLKNCFVITLLEKLELAAYRAADEVVVVSDGFREQIARRGIPESKVHTIRNGVDVDRFTPGSDSGPGRESLEIPDGSSLVLYLGAHGISHGLDAVVRAAQRLQHAPIVFALVGEGAMKARLQEQAKSLGLTNVTFHAGVPREQVPALLAAADICLVPLRDVPLFSTFIPSKIFEYFGAGKAVVGAVTGEPAAILDEGGALVVPPEDDASLAKAITKLVEDAELRSSMGAAGRAYVEEHFDRRKLAAIYREVLTP